MFCPHSNLTHMNTRSRKNDLCTREVEPSKEHMNAAVFWYFSFIFSWFLLCRPVFCPHLGSLGFNFVNKTCLLFCNAACLSVLVLLQKHNMLQFRAGSQRDHSTTEPWLAQQCSSSSKIFSVSYTIYFNIAYMDPRRRVDTVNVINPKPDQILLVMPYITLLLLKVILNNLEEINVNFFFLICVNWHLNMVENHSEAIS